MCVRARVCVLVCVRVCVQLCMFVYVRACVCVCLFAYVRLCSLCLYACVRVYVCAYTEKEKDRERTRKTEIQINSHTDKQSDDNGRKMELERWPISLSSCSPVFSSGDWQVPRGFSYLGQRTVKTQSKRKTVA